MTGISLTEKAAGKSVTPGAKGGTFIPLPRKPAIEVGPVDCGSVLVGTTKSCSTPIKSVGTGRLHITSIKMTNGDSAEFDTSEKCVGRGSPPGTAVS